MIGEVQAFGFPCGETNCMNLANKELQITTLDDDYRLPLCPKHAQRLAQQIEKNDRPIPANN